MVTHFFPDEPLLAADDPFLRGVLAPPVLDVVNSYFGLWAKLMSVDVWYSIPHDIGRRIGSQKWHRDPEDRQMLKVYFYWSDVLDGAGPMEYVEGSAHAGGRMRSYRSWKPFDRVSRYPEENELEARIAEMKIQPVQCAGPAGTVFFCDTSGFHRGGVASTKARLLTVWTFVTPAAMEHVSVSRRYFRVDRSRGWDRLSEPARFALS
jgi:hypothetical protein